MTVSVGYLGNGFSIIAGDTMVIKWRREKRKFIIEDNTKTVDKSELGHFGWVTTMGKARVCEIFRQYVKRYRFKTRNSIFDIFVKSMFDAEPEIGLSGATSSAIYSFNFFKDGILTMQVEKVGIEGRKRLTGENSLLVRPPKQTKRINLLIEKYTLLAKDIKDMHTGIYLVAKLIDDMSKLTKLINNSVNIGISSKWSDTELIYMKVSANCKTIIKLYEKTWNLSELWMIQRIENYGGIENGISSNK